MTSRASTPVLIVFLDLTRFAAQSLRTADTALADTLDAYYERVGAAVRQAGGMVVKFIGDAALAVFPETTIDPAVAMLLTLKEEVDAFLADHQWECRLTARVHYGVVMAGPYGEADAKRYDVIGSAVNTAATLPSRGLTLSAEAFGKLSPSLQTRFRKHQPPITYSRAEEV